MPAFSAVRVTFGKQRMSLVSKPRFASNFVVEKLGPDFSDKVSIFKEFCLCTFQDSNYHRALVTNDIALLETNILKDSVSSVVNTRVTMGSECF